MKFQATIPSRSFALPQQLAVSSGPIALTFHCSIQTPPGRIRVHGTAPGAAFVLDAATTRSDGETHIDGELQVCGTLAGLGQRELALQARRLVSALAGVP